MKCLFLILLSSLCCPPPALVVEKWAIEKESNLYFEGKSNVSNFRCGIGHYLRPDTLCFYRDDNAQPTLKVKGGLCININAFDCQQAYMNNDLRKTLKAAECPVMKISLLSIGNFTGAVKAVKGIVAISLAGVTRTVDIDYAIQSIDNNNLRLHGKRQVLFSDFGLTPPRKLAGMIKVEQQIDVSFMLVLRAIK